MQQTSRERVLSALTGALPDRLPVISVCQYATYDLMKKTGAAWPEAHYDGKMMAALARGGADVFGFDAVRVPFCQTVEAEIFGAEIDNGGKTMIPSIRKSAMKIGDAAIVPENFTKRGRIPAVLDAIRILKREVGNETAVMGSLVGPFSVSAGLLGITSLLKASIKAPDSLVPYLDIALAAARQYAEAMVEAGADVIVIEDMMASLDIISPKIYRKLVFPYQKALIEVIGVPVILHICGKLDRVIDDLGQTGAAALSVEKAVDIPAALTAYKEREQTIRFAGTVDPVGALLQGTPEIVRLAVDAAIESGVVLLSPGCAVPPDTPFENMMALTEEPYFCIKN